MQRTSSPLHNVRGQRILFYSILFSSILFCSWSLDGALPERLTAAAELPAH